MKRVVPVVAVGTGLALGALAVGRWALPALSTEPVPPMVVERLAPAPTVEGAGTSLLLVTWDTVRADRVSAYGHTLPTTPTFDRLASEGLFFTQYLVPQATTLPTHLSMFTGLHPEEHGVVANSRGGKRFVVPEGLVSVASHLGARGFHTAGFVSSTPLKIGSGAERGFQVYGVPAERKQPGAPTVDAALDWLGDLPPGASFLLWVHLVDPHAPYEIPPGYADVLPPDAGIEAWLADRRMRANPTTIARLRAYDAEIRYTDDQTGRLLEALDRLGRQDVAVVISGDHGEGLGQHGEREHGGNWHEQLATPLVMRVPGVAPRRVDALTSAEDLVPTLVSHVDWPDEAVLTAPMSGVDALAPPTDRVLIARRSDREVRKLADGTAWTVTDPDSVLIVAPQRTLLFDRASDPHQQRPVVDPKRAAPLRARLEAAQAVFAARAAELGAGRTATMDPTEKSELEALGYVE